MDLDVLTEALDHLREVGPSSLADGESIEELHRQLARMESLVAESVAAFEASGEWEADGARDATAWLTLRCRLPRREARRRVLRGRELRHLPESASAWERGEITGAHLDVLASLRTEATEEALARDEELLVGEACRLRYDQFVALTAYWNQRADPGGRVEISPTTRLFTGATRRAIEVRDRGCTHPTCDVKASRCQIDHIQPWALGGPTTQDNGRLLCGFHNRLRNHQNQRPPPRE